MKPLYAVILLVIIVLIIYWLANNNNANITNNPEYFTILKEIQGQVNPAKNDPMINSNENNAKYSAKKIDLNRENFASDSFVTVQGNKVRRELVPSNYADYTYADANFTLNQDSSLKTKTIPKKFTPQAWNIYFD